MLVRRRASRLKSENSRVQEASAFGGRHKMNTEIVQADFGLTLVAVLITLASSAVTACLAAVNQWMRKKNTKVTIKTGTIEISYDISKLNSKDIASIIDTLADKSDGPQAKT
jgi:hypothetical protein